MCLVTSGSIQFGKVGRIIVLSLVFVTAVLMFGEKTVALLVRLFYQVFNKMQVKLLFPLSLAFLMAAFANYIGLAAIVAAFVAGLIVCDEHFESTTKGSPTTQELISRYKHYLAQYFSC